MKQRSIPSHGHKWASVCHNIRKECPDVVYKSNELLDIVIVLGCSPLPDVGNLICINMDPILVDHVAEAIHPLCIQIAFCPFEVELVLSQAFKHETQVLLMFLNCIGVHKDIVQVYMHAASNSIAKYCGHQSLECHGSITVSNPHYMAHKRSGYCCEHVLANIFNTYSNSFIQ